MIDLKIAENSFLGDREKDQSVDVDKLEGLMTDLVDVESRVDRRTESLVNVKTTLAESETRIHLQVVTIVTVVETAPTIIVEDRIEDQDIPIVEAILRQTVTVQMTVVHLRKMNLKVQRLVLKTFASNCKSLMEQDLGNPGGRISKIVPITIVGLNETS